MSPNKVPEICKYARMVILLYLTPYWLSAARAALPA